MVLRKGHARYNNNSNKQLLPPRTPCSENAKMAVKKGVVEPIAWLKLIGMYFRLRLPKTMVKQKMVESRETFQSWRLDFSGLIGVRRVSEST